MFGFLETIMYWSVARVVFKPNVAPQKEMLLAGFVCAEDAHQLFENYTFIFPHWMDRLRRNCNWLEISGSSPPSHYQRSEAEKIKVTKWSNLGCAAIFPFCFSTFISCLCSLLSCCMTQFSLHPSPLSQMAAHTEAGLFWKFLSSSPVMPWSDTDSWIDVAEIGISLTKG